MKLLPAEVIRKKRFAGEHSQQELHFLIHDYVANKIPDYQMAAWLMAVCFNGMSPRETAWLTQEMRDSGLVLDLGHLNTTVDKHSTGGLGDKTSLLLAPIVAALGIPVPMMAGRGLAHTGGTLDKLESIAGFNVQIDYAHFKNQLQSVGAAITGQTHEVCPADRKLYALRDVTGTVDSPPLICASIMSKKLAEGMAALVLDVKVGSGAFMKDLKSATDLAQSLVGIGKHFDKQVIALITRMDEPLGRFVGNALEVRECLDILQNIPASDEGKDYSDTLELTIELAAHMILLGGKASSLEQAKSLAAKCISDGSAFKKFKEIVYAQGGTLEKDLPRAAFIESVKAPISGYLQYVNLEKMGMACVHLGAGRAFQSDLLDYSAGLEIFCNNGQTVRAGDLLFNVHHSSKEKFSSSLAILNESYVILPQPIQRSPLIAKVIL